MSVTVIRGGLLGRQGAWRPLAVNQSRTLFIPAGAEKLTVRYAIENRGRPRLQTRFASEWNFNLLGGGGNDQAYYHVDGLQLDNDHFDSTGEVFEVRNFHVGNRWLQQDIRFTLSEAATLWRFSIETVTASEAGFERNHHGSCLTLLWPLLLNTGQRWNVEIHCNGQSVE